MEVTLPPLQAPRVVQEDSIADVTPQAYESEPEDNDDPVYQLIEHFIIITSGYVSVYYVYYYNIMFSCVHQGDVDCKSGVAPTNWSVFGQSFRTNNDGITESTRRRSSRCHSTILYIYILYIYSYFRLYSGFYIVVTI